MSWIRRFFKAKEEAVTPIRCTIPDEEMYEFQRTGVVLNIDNAPFMTLTESLMPNTWYHHDLDYLFTLTSMGFRVINGSKEALFSRGFERVDKGRNLLEAMAIAFRHDELWYFSTLTQKTWLEVVEESAIEEYKNIPNKIGEKKKLRKKMEINRCRLFGHKWVPVYVKGRFNSVDHKFIACYCTRCDKGFDDCRNIVESATQGTYNESYYDTKYVISKMIVGVKHYYMGEDYQWTPLLEGAKQYSKKPDISDTLIGYQIEEV